METGMAQEWIRNKLGFLGIDQDSWERTRTLRNDLGILEMSQESTRNGGGV
jgi:hypothetical protein